MYVEYKKGKIVKIDIITDLIVGTLEEICQISKFCRVRE